jgi:hypothetical protein
MRSNEIILAEEMRPKPIVALLGKCKDCAAEILYIDHIRHQMTIADIGGFWPGMAR